MIHITIPVMQEKVEADTSYDKLLKLNATVEYIDDGNNKVKATCEYRTVELEITSIPITISRVLYRLQDLIFLIKPEELLARMTNTCMSDKLYELQGVKKYALHESTKGDFFRFEAFYGGVQIAKVESGNYDKAFECCVNEAFIYFLKMGLLPIEKP